MNDLLLIRIGCAFECYGRRQIQALIHAIRFRWAKMLDTPDTGQIIILGRLEPQRKGLDALAELLENLWTDRKLGLHEGCLLGCQGILPHGIAFRS